MKGDIVRQCFEKCLKSSPVLCLCTNLVNIVSRKWSPYRQFPLPSYGIYTLQWVRFAMYCTSVLDFHSKNLQITLKPLTQDYRYHKLRKTFWKSLRSYSELLSKFGEISFQEYVFSRPDLYGDLVYKLRSVKCAANFVSFGSKMVKPIRRRQYDPVIIKRTICLMLWPFYSLVQIIPRALYSD